MKHDLLDVSINESYGSKCRLHQHNFPYLSSFQGPRFPPPTKPQSNACLRYGGKMTSNHIPSSLNEKWKQSRVFQLCFGSFCRNRICSYGSESFLLTLHLPAHHLHLPAGEMLRCRVVHIPHPTHCIKHSHPSARRHTLRCPHTARGLQVKQVADRCCIFLEPLMCHESIYRGRREK